MGKGGERGNCSRPFPSSILDTSSSPQDFFWTRPNSLSVSTSKMAGEHLCHCSHCKVHLVCRLCICLVIIEERRKGRWGKPAGKLSNYGEQSEPQAFPSLFASGSRVTSRDFLK